MRISRQNRTADMQFPKPSVWGDFQKPPPAAANSGKAILISVSVFVSLILFLSFHLLFENSEMQIPSPQAQHSMDPEFRDSLTDGENLNSMNSEIKNSLTDGEKLDSMEPEFKNSIIGSENLDSMEPEFKNTIAHFDKLNSIDPDFTNSIADGEKLELMDPVSGNLITHYEELVKSSLLRPCQQKRKLKKWVLNEQQQKLVDVSGLGNLVLTMELLVDRFLLTAFCERWNNETNTAHFSGFEMAPSLRDVAYILGIPVTGHVVTGEAIGDKAVQELCLQYLGENVGTQEHKAGYIRVTWLYSKFHQLPENPTDDDIMYSTRAYLLYLIGSTLLPETMEGFVSPRYLLLLVDFEKIREYAWGAAALAHLYRGLSNTVTKNSARLFSGSATLLMAWIYEYLPVMRPQKTDEMPTFPRACKWNCKGVIPRPRKKVVEFRRDFDRLQFSDVNWEPYKDMDLATIPDYCIVSDDICVARTWLISFHVIEICVPDRYARQFGREQHPPDEVPLWQRRRWSMSVDWRLEFAREIEEFHELIKFHNFSSSKNENATLLTSATLKSYIPNKKPQKPAGPSLSSVVNDLKKDLPVIACHLEGKPLPFEVARSLERVKKLIGNLQLAKWRGRKPGVKRQSHPTETQNEESSDPQNILTAPQAPQCKAVPSALPEANGLKQSTIYEVPVLGSPPMDAASSPEGRRRKRKVEMEEAQALSDGEELRKSRRRCLQMKRFEP